MDRKYLDCRDFPESKCSVTLAADSEEELMQAAVEHGVKTHGFEDTPEMREKIRGSFKSSCPC